MRSPSSDSRQHLARPRRPGVAAEQHDRQADLGHVEAIPPGQAPISHSPAEMPALTIKMNPTSTRKPAGPKLRCGMITASNATGAGRLGAAVAADIMG